MSVADPKLHLFEKMTEAKNMQTGFYHFVLDVEKFGPQVFVSFTSHDEITKKTAWKELKLKKEDIIASGEMIFQKFQNNLICVNFNVDKKTKEYRDDEEVYFFLEMMRAFDSSNLPTKKDLVKVSNIRYYGDKEINIRSNAPHDFIQLIPKLQIEKTGPFFGQKHTYKQLCDLFKERKQFNANLSFMKGPVTVKVAKVTEKPQERSLRIKIPDGLVFSLNYEGSIFPCMAKESKMFSNRHSQCIRSTYAELFAEWHEKIDAVFDALLKEFTYPNPQYALEQLRKGKIALEGHHEAFKRKIHARIIESFDGYYFVYPHVKDLLKKGKFTIDFNHDEIDVDAEIPGIEKIT